jgi:hypothetical protein
MNRFQRADLGLISSVLREQRRALHPRVHSHHKLPPITKTSTALAVMDVQRGIAPPDGRTRRKRPPDGRSRQ